LKCVFRAAVEQLCGDVMIGERDWGEGGTE